MKGFFHRHQPPASIKRSAIYGIGGLIGIALLGALTDYTDTYLLMAPFGASCVLLFSVPASPLSQPINVLAGHMLASIVALALRVFFPNIWWAVGIAVGLSIALMAALRITHPPAGADPIVIFMLDPEIDFLVAPVFLGSIVLIATAVFTHRLAGIPYPIKPKD